MQSAAITPYIDVAQLVLYAFWIFFAGLIYYLHRENKREGYPLESNVKGRNPIEGFPPTPAPKQFRMASGEVLEAPRREEVQMVLDAAPVGGYPGAPIEPNGPGLGAGVGPGAYAQRRDICDVSIDGSPRIMPLRAAAGKFAVWRQDKDPRGLPVVGSDGVVGGVVREMWVDRSEVLFRYLEVEVSTPGTGATTSAGSSVLVPSAFARIGRNRVVVDSVLGSQLGGVPRIRADDRITFLEEEKVMAYFGGGTLYATPQRAEPLL